MAVRRSARPAILAAAAALAGVTCVEFVGPEEPGLPELDAQLILVATLLDSGDAADCDDECPPGAAPAATLQVHAQFFPGTDAEGWLRPVATDTLRILDTAIIPAVVDDHGWHFYEALLDVGSPGEEGAVLPVTLPAPSSRTSNGEAMTMSWRSAGRAGPARLTVRKGDSVTLRTGAWPGDSDPPPNFERWQLELWAGDALLTLGTVGRPPPELFIPGVWIPDAADGVVTARLVLDQRAGLTRPGRYAIGTTLRVVLLWTLEIVETWDDEP